MNYPFVFFDTVDKIHSGTIPAQMVGIERWVCDPTYGMRCYVPVYNGTGGTLAANAPVRWKSGELTGEIVAASQDEPVASAAGLLETALTNLYWGWACRKGVHPYTADEAIDADDLLMAGVTAGSMYDPAVAGLEHCIWGRAIDACNDTETGYMRLCLP